MHADYPRANESAVIHTKFGTFYDAVCYAPSARPIAAGFFFYAFTLSTAFVVLSLFVSVITSVMFEAMTLKEIERHREQQIHNLRNRKARENVPSLRRTFPL